MLSFLACLATLAVADKPDYEKLWEKFVADHSKSYPENGNQEQERFEIFKANVDAIYAHNAKGLSYTLALNKFADLTSDEFAKSNLGFNAGQRGVRSLPTTPLPNITVAESIDWVEKGAVTDVKNQMQCGSCWAFSTTGALEGAYQIASKNLISLSEQDLVSCDQDTNDGCKGGNIDAAFEWVEKHGVCGEGAYPYTSGAGISGTCTTTCTPEVTLTGITDIPKGDESALLQAVNVGPVSVAVDAGQVQLYSAGILDTPECGRELDHAVLVVGYGTDNGKDYWKVKNSWGADWGEDGYVRIVRDKAMCGIADMASYPTGVKSMGPLPPPPAPTPPAPATPTPAPTSPAPAPATPTPAPTSPAPAPTPPRPKPTPTTDCKFPDVQACYKASLQTCWIPFQEKNELTSAALATLSDQKVASGIRDKVLIGGSEWKDVWSTQTEGENVYLTAYKSVASDFLVQYQLAQATLLVSEKQDAQATDAYNKLTDQFDGVFYNKHGCGVNNTVRASVVVV